MGQNKGAGTTGLIVVASVLLGLSGIGNMVSRKELRIMTDQEKTKEQLISELVEIRKRAEGL